MEKQKQSGLGIASLILGIVGLISCCIIIGIIPCIIGLILGIIALSDKKYSHGTAIAGVVCSGLGIFLFVIVLLVGIFSPEDKNTETNSDSQIVQSQSEENKEIIIESEIQTESKIETEIEEKELSEEEYKSLCEELYYDDVFFGKEDLENKYVKLHLFLTSKQFFTADTILYSDSWKKYNDKYNLKRDLFECSVLRENADSYAGKGKIDLWFSENYELDANNYKTGEKVIVYAQVISWSNNTWDGYNSVTVIPKYIESEK